MLLPSYFLLETRDLEEAREITARYWQTKHESNLINPQDNFSFSLNSAILNSMDINYMDFTSQLEIKAEVINNQYLVMFYLEGMAELNLGKTSHLVCNNNGIIIGLPQSISFFCEATNKILIVSFDAKILQDNLENMINFPLRSKLKFADGLSLNNSFGQSFQHLLLWLCEQLEKHHPDHLIIRELEQQVLTQILIGQPHNYSEFLQQGKSGETLRRVLLVENYLEAYADQPFSLTTLAELLQISSRSIQLAFRQHRDYTPRQFLQQVRLSKVKQELENPQANITVHQAAEKWGFHHLGRFARDYHQMYGEFPSQTLKRNGYGLLKK